MQNRSRYKYFRRSNLFLFKPNFTGIILRACIFVSTIFVFTRCDPGLSGNLRIFNESDQVLKFKFEVESDSTFIEIAPHSDLVILELGGLGSNKSAADCCPCLVGTIIIKSPIGNIKKDPEDGNNWNIPNKSKLKKFGTEDVRCEFHVTNEDL